MRSYAASTAKVLRPFRMKEVPLSSGLECRKRLQCWTFKEKAPGFSRISATVYQSTRRITPEDLNLHKQRQSCAF